MCAPKAPDPAKTIQQQTASNKQTAIAQAGLNYVNQIGPNGTLTYEQIGKWSDGTPRFQSTTALSDAGKALQTTTEGTTQNLANVAKEQSARLSGLLNAPNDWSQQQSYLENLTSGALDKSWDRQAEQFETSLVNRGIRPGSTAYQQQLSDFSNNRSSAYNAANVNNFLTAQQSQAALRAQPLNEILALAGGSQVQTPQFGQVNSPQMAGTDVGGITNSGYANQLSQYNANQKLLGGLFDAGSNLLLSDRRAKKNIVRIGQTDAGTPLYKFEYIHGGPTQIGVMAQDLLETQPNAVVMGPDGFYRVNYSEVV